MRGCNCRLPNFQGGLVDIGPANGYTFTSTVERGGRKMSLGENIARLRAQNGWSQGELADKLEVSRQSVSKWETDLSHS